MKRSLRFINDSNDPTFENWLSLFACIVNEKLSPGEALSIMGIACEGRTYHLKGGIDHEC